MKLGRPADDNGPDPVVEVPEWKDTARQTVVDRENGITPDSDAPPLRYKALDPSIEIPRAQYDGPLGNRYTAGNVAGFGKPGAHLDGAAGAGLA